ncbi:MAG: tyrosine-type recombinase/integrase [Opitutaceae bacterium]|nr:tyrosine-type recombinase/integrase [Opitutaceae bacterium]
MNNERKVLREPTGYNPIKRQDNDKTAKPIRVRSGMGTVAYWRAKLFRNSYRDREGRTVEIPEYYVRMRHDGQTKRVRLHTSDKDRAAEEALRLAERLESEGWHAVTSGQARLPASPTIDEYCDAYAKATEGMPKPPRAISVATYVRSLKQLCALAGVKQIRDLDRNAIGKAGEVYRAQGRKSGRKDPAIINTFAKILRNAAACFSDKAREVLERNGLKLGNPFEGVERSQDIRRFEPLKPELIDRIMADAHLLLMGDPNAMNPETTAFATEHKKAHGRLPQWRDIDFRKPHPDAYAALLLAYGAGLRANEIDKARWEWLQHKDGIFLIQIPEEEADFKPKGGEGRTVRIQAEVFAALHRSRVEASPYIIGGSETTGKAARGLAYRSPLTFRKINLWLRDRGVEKGKSRGHPLHTLRKQYGSVIATHHGLFHAQHLLGHKSPVVTSKYYASPTASPEMTHFKIVP